MKNVLSRVLILSAIVILHATTNCGYFKHDLRDHNCAAGKYSLELHKLVVKLADLKGTPGTAEKCITAQEQLVEAKKASAAIWLQRTTANNEDLSPSKQVLLNDIKLATKIVGADYDEHVVKGLSGSHASVKRAYVMPNRDVSGTDMNEDMDDEL